MTNHVLTLAVSSALWSAAVGAQRTTNTVTTRPTDSTTVASTAGCPGGNGIHISATSGTPSDSSAGVNRVIGLGESVDTTLVFNISQKTWTRTNLAAALSVGLADDVRGRYAICAGVTALMPSATLTLRGARGRVHFVASLKELRDALRLGPGR
ncbi:MAG: hypothetical protein ACJ77R_00260 [Gemmatimonadaceae bacterium]